MTNDTIEIPQRRNVEAKPFYADRTDKALEACEDEKYEALFMPDILDARIDSPNDHFVWRNWFKTPSIRVTGTTGQGKKVVVFAHILNPFSKSANITTAIEQGLINGAGKIPQTEFQRLYDMKDDRLVFVVPYEILKESSSGIIKLKDAIKHPQTIPFCGGVERAVRYLERYNEVYGNTIGIWHLDDLHDEPSGRLLIVGSDYDGGLDGNGDFDGAAHFLGVRSGTGEACTKNFFPPQDKLVEIINESITTFRTDVTNRVKSLYS